MDVLFVFGKNLQLRKDSFVTVHINRFVTPEVVANLDNLVFVQGVSRTGYAVDIAESLYASSVFDADTDVPAKLCDEGPKRIGGIRAACSR